MAMSMRELIPWGRNRSLPASSQSDNANPFWALHREMNRIFDEFSRSFDLPMLSQGWSTGWPNVEVSETENEVKVVAELPGLEEKDIEVTLHNGTLTLKGEKKSETQVRLTANAGTAVLSAHCSSAPMWIRKRSTRGSKTAS